MSDSQDIEPKSTPPRSLISVSQIRDVHLVEMHASAPEDGTYEILHINLRIGDQRFRSAPGLLQVRMTARVLYFTEDPNITPEEEVTSDKDAVGSIVLEYVVDLELSDDVNSSEINDESVEELVDSTLIFILFPYVRATVQRISGELPFPHTVIPFMLRNI